MYRRFCKKGGQKKEVMAYGCINQITLRGRRQILAVELAHRESQTGWKDILLCTVPALSLCRLMLILTYTSMVDRHYLLFYNRNVNLGSMSPTH